MSDAAITRVLFVCTANECRSPFAAAIASRAATGLPVRFDSAGLESWQRPVPAAGLAHAREIGIDLAKHVSESVRPDDLPDYDLILGLAREHTRHLLADDPVLRPRLFTVKQFARWVDGRQRPPGIGLGAWLDQTASGRPGAEFLGANTADDVEDPLRLPIARWRLMSAELTSAIDQILAAIFPSQEYPR